MNEIVLERVDAASDDACWAMGEYVAELDRRFPTGFDATGVLDEAALDLNPPRGAFLLARRDGAAVGCGGVTFLDERVAELKRMWISPTCRGAGLGRRLLGALEAEARDAGRSVVILDTNGSLVEAVAMYQRCGYVATERYNDNPYATHWFTKTLPDVG